MEAKKPEAKKRVLLADDDSDLVGLLKIDLLGLGFEVTTATNGRDALQLSANNQFDLVILDVMMPYMDGYHVAQEISARQASKPPKILIVTSRDTTAEEGIILMSGADAFLQKPFSMEEFHNKIKEVLGG